MNELKKYDLDYLHISLGNIFGTSLRDKENKTPILSTLQNEVGKDIPLIGVGKINTPDDAVKAMNDFGIPLIAIGRQLIVDPDSIEKVLKDKEENIRTEIHANNREDLKIPDAMWDYVKSRPGWLPIIDN